MARLDFANARLGARRSRLLGAAGLREVLARPSLEARLADWGSDEDDGDDEEGGSAKKGLPEKKKKKLITILTFGPRTRQR